MDYVYKTKFRGAQIRLSTSKKLTEHELENAVQYFDDDFECFKSKYDRILKEGFDELVLTADRWYGNDTDWENTKNKAKLLQRFAGNPDLIVYKHVNSSKYKNGLCSFDIWFNDHGQNDEFFDGHSATISASLYAGGKQISIDVSLNG